MTSFEKIYKLMFSPLATPYSVLSNFKQSNYEYVKFYCEKGLSVAEMKCRPINDDTFVIFYYYFNENDELNFILKEKNGSKEKVFDRELETIREKAKYKLKQNNDIQSVV